MQTWVIEIPKSHVYIIYIFNSFFTFDNNLHTVQARCQMKKIRKLAFVFIFTYSKMQGFLTEIKLIDTFLVWET